MARGRAAFALGLLLAAGSARAELTDGPAPIGAFVERAIELQVELQAWPTSCGPLPIASQIPGRGTVSLDLRGGALIVRSKRPPLELSTATCADAPVPLVLEGSSREGAIFRTTCRASDGSRRQQVRATFHAPDDVLFAIETTFSGACRGRTTELRSFRRSVPTPAPVVAEVDAGAPEPDAGVTEVPLVVVRPRAREAKPAELPAPFVPLEGVELAVPEEGGYELPVEELGAGGVTAVLGLGLALLLLGVVAIVWGVRRARRRPPACPACRAQIPAEARFCPHCRAKLR